MIKFLRSIILVGGFVFFLYYVSNITIDVVAFAEEPRKSYEELQQELSFYKKATMVEAGFRTIDIIFGWNNVFSNVGHFFDNIITVLDSYYLWTPIKYITIFSIGFIVACGVINNILGIDSPTDLAELIASLPKDQSGFIIKDNNEFVKIVMNAFCFEQKEIVNEVIVWVKKV